MPKHIEEKRNECLYCGKKIAVLCGTPLIRIGGCCYGATDETTDPPTKWVFARLAHIECWLKEKKLTIIKDNQRRIDTYGNNAS